MGTNAVTKVLEREVRDPVPTATTTLDAAARQGEAADLARQRRVPGRLHARPVGQRVHQRGAEARRAGCHPPLDDLIGEDTPNITAALENEPESQGDGDGHGRAPSGGFPVEGLLPLLVPAEAVDELRLAGRSSDLEMPKTPEDLNDRAAGVQDRGPQRQRKGRRGPPDRGPQDSCLPLTRWARSGTPGGANKGIRSLLAVEATVVRIRPAWNGARGSRMSAPCTPRTDRRRRLHPERAGAQPKGNSAGRGPALRLGATALDPAFVQPTPTGGRDKQYDAVPPLTGPVRQELQPG